MRGSLLGLLALWAAGCGSSSVDSPFPSGDAGVEAGDAEAGLPGAPADAGPDADPSLGGPCLDDEQCDDGVDCTTDRCDELLGRCRFTADHTRCADDVYCDGMEVCELGLGCREGEPVTCSDDYACTIDACVEESQSCEHSPRDADGDGDPVWNCEGGGDCNDHDPRVSSLVPEICGNQVDDDCDGVIDESDCETPEHDTCVDPLEISGSQRVILSMAALASDYAASCADLDAEGATRDGVVALIVPEGDPVDVVVTATGGSDVALAAFSQCGSAASEVACGEPYASAAGGSVAKLRLRALEAGAHALLVFAEGAGEVVLDIRYEEATAPADNETGDGAALLEPDVPVTVGLEDARSDVGSVCDIETGELFFRFELPEPSDVHLYAVSADGLGEPVLSLGDDCTEVWSELACRVGPAPHLFARALPAGSYYVAVGATAPTDVSLRLEVQPPSEPAADETCEAPPALAPNRDWDLTLAGHTDDVELGCPTGGIDAVGALELSERSDVLLIARSGADAELGVSLVTPDCSTHADLLVCKTGAMRPLRARRHDLPAGSYRVVVDATAEIPVRATVLARPAAAPGVVPFADTCAQAVQIPPSGGAFYGSTVNAGADYAAGCDLGGQSGAGAADQMLKLTLERRQRVVLDMDGSNYATLLDVRRGPDCPGEEVPRGCTIGTGSNRSFLDLTLDPGSYFIQIDGYAGAEGEWLLEVFITDPADESADP